MKALTVAGKRAVTKGDQKAITAGYLRVSTDSDEQANALVVQEDAVKRFGVDVLYQDVLSGAGVTRPGYEELKELVFTRQVGRIVINNVSRLGRDFAEAISFVAMCDEQCVELISLDQKDRPLTLKDSTQLLMTIFPMAIAATYKMDNQKKILAGYKNGRAMGKPMRKPCWGYQLSHDRLRFQNRLQTLMKLVVSLITSSETAGGCGRRSVHSIGRIMKNALSTGSMVCVPG